MAMLEGAAVTLTPAEVAVVARALADAEHYHRDFAAAWCAGCAVGAPGAGCPDHAGYLAPASAYSDLAAELAHLTNSARRGACNTATGPDQSRLRQERSMTTLRPAARQPCSPGPRKPATCAQLARAAGILLGAGGTPERVRAYGLPISAGIADAMEEVLRLRATCEAAVQRVPCGLDGCGACAGLACDGGTGVHVVRLGSAMKRRVITGRQLVEALRSAVIFTGSTVIRPDGAR